MLKAARGLIEDKRRGGCHENNEMVEHLVTGCSVLSNSEYLARQRTLLILAVTSEKEHRLIGVDTVCTMSNWSKWMVLENDKGKKLRQKHGPT